MIIELNMLKLGRDEISGREIIEGTRKVLVNFVGPYVVGQDLKGRGVVELSDEIGMVFKESYSEIKSKLGVQNDDTSTFI